jgi:predicted N-acetyltransferase YhbS
MSCAAVIPRACEHDPGMNIEYLSDHISHVPMVAAWQQAQFGYLAPTVTLAERTERLRGALQKDALPMALIALSAGGIPAGSASLLATTITHRHLTPWLSSVYVPAEFRRSGIASALGRRALIEAARLGFDQLYLFTPEALYGRLGWETFERTAHNDLPITLMRRNTTPP